MVEQRGLGILRLSWKRLARIRLIVDLDAPVATRLPMPATRDLFTIALPVLAKPPCGSFSAAIQRYLQGGTLLETDWNA